VLSTDNTVRELGEIVREWGRYELGTPDERDDVHEAGAELLAAAVRGQVTAVGFERLLGRLTDPALDLRAALSSAGRGGITAGTRPPRIEPGERPAMRRVRRLSQGEHDRLVWAAMHDAVELRRPAPPRTGELDALTDWMRARGPAGDGRCTVLAYADAASLSVQPGGRPPAGDATSDRLNDLIRALRRAESDPRYGRWLFLRVETTGAGLQVERRYDSWPQWWDDDGVSGPWRTNLQHEMAARHEEWRPRWARLLAPEVAYRPA
jgi:hypothetical protein